MSTWAVYVCETWLWDWLASCTRRRLSVVLLRPTDEDDLHWRMRARLDVAVKGLYRYPTCSVRKELYAQ